MSDTLRIVVENGCGGVVDGSVQCAISALKVSPDAPLMPRLACVGTMPVTAIRATVFNCIFIQPAFICGCPSLTSCLLV